MQQIWDISHNQLRGMFLATLLFLSGCAQTTEPTAPASKPAPPAQASRPQAELSESKLRRGEAALAMEAPSPRASFDAATSWERSPQTGAAALHYYHPYPPPPYYPRPPVIPPGNDRFPDKEPTSVLSVAEHPVSTFSVDVDTASNAFVRRALTGGRG